MNNKVKESLQSILSSKDYPRYGYMMLGRLQSDCDYYLGYGDRLDKYLFMGNTQDHIELMKALWNELEEKPEWLTYEQIEEYEQQMCKQ